MAGKETLKAELERFVARHGTRTAAAEALGISRMDLYRYLHQKTVPRPKTVASLISALERTGAPKIEPAVDDQSDSFELDTVTKLRDLMLQCVTLLELDLARRGGNAGKGG